MHLDEDHVVLGVMPLIHRTRWAPGLLAASLAVVSATPASGNLCGESAAGEEYFWAATSGQTLKANNCSGSTGFRCYKAVAGIPYFRLKTPSCNPVIQACTVEPRNRGDSTSIRVNTAIATVR